MAGAPISARGTGLPCALISSHETSREAPAVNCARHGIAGTAAARQPQDALAIMKAGCEGCDIICVSSGVVRTTS